MKYLILFSISTFIYSCSEPHKSKLENYNNSNDTHLNPTMPQVDIVSKIDETPISEIPEPIPTKVFAYGTIDYMVYEMDQRTYRWVYSYEGTYCTKIFEIESNKLSDLREALIYNNGITTGRNLEIDKKSAKINTFDSHSEALAHKEKECDVEIRLLKIPYF